jgi:hypothetical protein
MKKYYTFIRASVRREEAAIAAGTPHTPKCIGGAIFFAVCRGKVSEGLDFTDDNARGVISLTVRTLSLSLALSHSATRSCHLSMVLVTP